ncbi:hypothetical protein [Terriglobus sp. RCC_193]|uniref:hypothetical protein n=1 Tax=Terriglobus sp. RCC_193 TaxID=3239218 RepID=UPI0035252E40
MYGFAISTLIGVALGFMFGVGCALAVMYSIYMGGYREALHDMDLATKPKRWYEELAKVKKMEAKK